MTNASISAAPRTTPKIEPRKRSTKPSPAARTAFVSGQAMSAPTSSAPMTINANAIEVRHRRISGYRRKHRAEHRRERNRADQPQHPRDRSDQLAHDAAKECRQRRQADDEHDDPVERRHGDRATRPSSNSHSLASRVRTIDVDINSRFHHLSGARDAPLGPQGYLTDATMPLWPSVFSLSRAASAASREG